MQHKNLKNMSTSKTNDPGPLVEAKDPGVESCPERRILQPSKSHCAITFLQPLLEGGLGCRGSPSSAQRQSSDRSSFLPSQSGMCLQCVALFGVP